MAQEGVKLEAQVAGKAREKSGSLSNKLKQKNRGNGITATELVF